ncbi:MAG: hypothetical protein [Caudoviricetes sp.]|nr:MAG: hypothetical protein [Caudoviricetes sp.]
MNKWVVIGVFLLVFGIQMGVMNNLSEKVGKYKESIDDLEKKQEQIQKDLQKYIDVKNSHETQIRELENDARQIKTNLDKKKERPKAFIAKPSLMEKKINEDFKKAADRLSCSTGATERCVN